MMLAVIIILNLHRGAILAQQPKPSPEPPRFPEAPASARIWKSLTTGKEYRVWTSNSQLYAEWINITPEFRQHGAYIRTECQRAGTRWIGISHSLLPCEREGNNRKDYNWCPWVTKIEIDRVEADRMTGRAEGLKRHDCNGCKILETVWKDFEWVPKEPSAVGK
jgi:hypothetical protein